LPFDEQTPRAEDGKWNFFGKEILPYLDNWRWNFYMALGQIYTFGPTFRAEKF
jgi:hypothetical protein